MKTFVQTWKFIYIIIHGEWSLARIFMKERVKSYLSNLVNYLKSASESCNFSIAFFRVMYAVAAPLWCWKYKHNIWTSLRESPSLGCLRKRVSTQSPQLQRIARKSELVASLDMILSNKRITKALIRLRSVQAGLRLCCSQAPRTGFLTSRPIFELVHKI